MLPASPKCLFPVPHQVEAAVFDPQHLSREVVAGITAPSVCMEAEQLSRELWRWIVKDLVLTAEEELLSWAEPA